MTLDGEGRIYAVVGRTGAVHVFDPHGRWLRVCLPDTDDITGELGLPDLTVSDSGDVYLGLEAQGNSGFLHFSPDGHRVGIEVSRPAKICKEWYAQPGTDRRWLLGNDRFYLIDATGAAVRTIAHRADGFWLEQAETAAAASDGSLALVSCGKRGAGGGEIAVSLYSPEGEPIRTFKLPQAVEWSSPRIAYDGKRVVVALQKAILLFEASGKALGQFTPAKDAEALWTPFLAPDGRRLLLFDGTRTLHRFELP